MEQRHKISAKNQSSFSHTSSRQYPTENEPPTEKPDDDQEETGERASQQVLTVKLMVQLALPLKHAKTARKYRAE